jgi:phosphoglycerol transferase
VISKALSGAVLGGTALRGIAPVRFRREALLATGVTGLLSAAGVWVAFGPMKPWLRYPLAYTNLPDSIFNLWVVKTVLETGWFGWNPWLGAPFGASALDFARPEVLFLLLLRGAGLFTSNVVLVQNVFYFAGFFLVAWSALLVLRTQLQISWPLAVAGALAFSWLPYHFARVDHLFLSNYMVVPMAAALILRVSDQQPPFFERGRLRLAHPGVWLALVLIASTSIYYAFFAIVLIAAEGVIGSLAARSLRPAASAAMLVGCLAVFLALALTPSLRHRAVEGTNPLVTVRNVGESDMYSLRPLHLLLPYGGHRFEALGALARTYNASAHDINENRTAALGLIGAAGFLLLLAHALTGNRVLPDTPAIAVFARATLVALLLGVTGGGGTLIALLVSPQFRGHNRISVYIAFFSIAAAMTAIDHALSRLGTRRRQATAGLAGVLIALAFVDQKPAPAPDLADITLKMDSDRAFVEHIERLVPAGAMVYQAPYTRFPEAPRLHVEPLYSPLRLYVNSHDVRWSFGGMKGRPADYWNQAVERLPMADRVALLQALGFAGIVLDREAFADRGRGYEAELARLGAGESIDSQDGTLAFHRLPASTPREDRVITLLPAPGPGFYAQEGEYPTTSRWAWGNASVFVHHDGSADLPVDLMCALRSFTVRHVTVGPPGAPGVTASLSAPGADVPLRFRMSLHPGWNVVRFETDQPAVRLTGGTDRRAVTFMVRELRLTPASPSDLGPQR